MIHPILLGAATAGGLLWQYRMLGGGIGPNIQTALTVGFSIVGTYSVDAGLDKLLGTSAIRSKRTSEDPPLMSSSGMLALGEAAIGGAAGAALGDYLAKYAQLI